MPWQLPFRLPYYKKETESRYTTATQMENIADEKTIMPTWMLSPPYGMIRLMRNFEAFNAQEMRILGRSPTVWQCKKIIADAVANAKWNILPVDPEKPNKTRMREIKRFLQLGGRDGVSSREPFRQLIFSATMDLLDLDAGVINNVYAIRLPDRLVKLHSRDGSSIFKATDPYGNILNYYQYDYRGINEPIKLEPREIAYFMMNPRSDSVYGEAPTETINLVIRSLTKGISTQELVYRKGGIPSGILATVGMSKEEHDRFTDWWNTSVKSKVYQRAMLNIPTDTGKSGSVNWIPLITSFRDMQFLETQHWFTELVYRTFKVPHGGIGTAARNVKGELGEETRKFMKQTVQPYLTTIEEVVNQQIISHMYSRLEEPDCYFHYPIVDLLQEKDELEVWEKKWEYGAATINEYRQQKSLDPLPWGEFNPLAMKNILPFGQTWWYGAIDDEGLHKATGIPKPKTAEILKRLQTQQQQASKPPPTAQEGETQENA